MNIYKFWNDILEQNADAIRGYFDKNAYINWHCTNEQFNVDEFIIANCEYPGSWNGNVERVEKINDIFVTATHVYSQNQELSFHVTSFIKVVDNKIAAMDEYWADDGIPPKWRLDKQIGKAICSE
ncbi:MAG: nuclear transport factor 2 family protein [Dorea sp.]|nr:nuclear transport factor 2 family protein [Dorea sp.]